MLRHMFSYMFHRREKKLVPRKKCELTLNFFLAPVQISSSYERRFQPYIFDDDSTERGKDILGSSYIKSEEGIKLHVLRKIFNDDESV